jgi:hypothetical protein
MKTYKGVITSLPDNGIYVFGSNTQGRHGKGSALVARTKFGAIYGQASGLQGRSYAIITKDLTKYKHPSISRDFIISQIKDLYDYALSNQEKDIYVAYRGSGSNLNSYSPQEMASMFSSHQIPNNMVFEEEFSNLL